MNIQHPRLTFDAKTHTYKWDGVAKPSVTQILSAVSVNGKPICDNRFFGTDHTARDFGNAFHKMSAMDYRGDAYSVPEEMRSWQSSFFKFRKEYSFLVPYFDIGSEQKIIESLMYSESLGFAGTPDIVAEPVGPCPGMFKRSIVVIDWKTSVSEMRHWRFQTAAYAHLLKEVCTVPTSRQVLTMSVRFHEHGYQITTRTAKEVFQDWNYFLSVLNVYKGEI